jgi:hypothetical protein
MMREILGVAQDGSEVRRRWFHDDYFDLFVWQAEAGEITSFQLCYGADTSERALVWRKDHGWFEDGATAVEPVHGNMAGTVLTPAPLAGDASTEPIASRFELAAGALPDAIRAAVAERLHAYAAKPGAAARRSRVRRAAWQKDFPGPG